LNSIELRILTSFAASLQLAGALLFMFRILTSEIVVESICDYGTASEIESCGMLGKISAMANVHVGYCIER